MLDFYEWYCEQCRIDAAELVGPNSPDFDALVERYEQDETRMEAARIRWVSEQG